MRAVKEKRFTGAKALETRKEGRVEPGEKGAVKQERQRIGR